MINKSIKERKLSRIFSAILWVLAGFVVMTTDMFAQNYEFTLNQRRMGDTIGVEVWAKSLNGSAPRLSNLTVPIAYNKEFLVPAALVAGSNPTKTTDSIFYDMDVANPYISINSPYSDALYGFGDLSAQALNNGTLYIFKLEVNASTGAIGYAPSTDGKGTFVGMLKFKIINHNNLYDAVLTNIAYNANASFAPASIADVNGNDVTSSVTFTNPGNFTVRGINILNPNGPNQAVNRYYDPALLSMGSNNGYPIYFERSGLQEPAIAGASYGTPKFGYYMEYSLDAGTTWSPIGYVAETTLTSVAMGGNDNWYRSGEIDYVSAANSRYISNATGGALTTTGTGYSGILRTIWKSSENYPYRSEQAKIRVKQLDSTGFGADITLRNNRSLDSTSRWDISNSTFVLGRLFFAQLNGTSSYFKSARTFDNATQLTVEAWINLNSVQATAGAEPAIVASSASTASPEEGAWMLYLDQGIYPAFRAREISGRGPGGYIGTVISPYALTAVSDAAPLGNNHSDNWVHIAATVEDGVVKLYVNGEEVNRYVNEESVAIRMLTTQHPIWIGVNPNGGIDAADYLHAGIKEVKVWRQALDANTIRSHMAGVYQPTNLTLAGERNALELYYPLQATRLDNASVFYEQNSLTPINYYNDPSLTAVAVNNLINYRPDRSHIRLTSPVGNEGISNLLDKVYPIRWAAYGLGKTEPGSSDLEIMVSRDGGLTWFDAIDNQVPSMPLDMVEIEEGVAYWEPYNNATIWGQSDDLQGVIDVQNNYEKNVRLKISGTTGRGQQDIYAVSSDFTVAPNFAFANKGVAEVQVKGNTELNLSSATTIIEAWIRPYRFPSAEEVYFPIVVKKSEDGLSLNYALKLLRTGQLQFEVASSTGDPIRTAISSANLDSVIKAPNVIEADTAWTHVAVYANLANGGQSTVVFYIDGTPQWVGGTPEQLGSAITIDNTNKYPVYLGTEPFATTNLTKRFIGALKEVRFWNGDPGNQTVSSNMENSDLTKFLQGALTVRADELGVYNGNDYGANLVAAYILNGGSWTNGGIKNTIPVYPDNENLYAHVTGSAYEYIATKPYMKVITPTFKQRVANSKEDLRVRWVGFDYNRNDLVTFRNGNDGVNPADLEFSIRGGGDEVVLHYQYVASQAYNNGYTNAMSLYANQAAYEFPGTFNKSQYAAELNVNVSDPDLNNDSTFNDQGPIAAANTNARLRLTGRSLINGYLLEYNNGTNGAFGYVNSLRVESPLFTITPPSNFTVRVLLEGYHEGTTNGIVANLGTTPYTQNGNGLLINLYTNNANQFGTYVSSSVSSNGAGSGGYLNTTTALATANRNAGANNFANVPFVFDTIADGRYFVVVDHINHLPIMSRFAAPFKFTGDDATTWAIESGWDFSGWNGVANNSLLSTEALTEPPTIGSKYTAYGYAETSKSESNYGTTALIYNDGRSGNSTDAIAAMVGGDVFKDGFINAADRSRVVNDNGTTLPRSLVKGNGVVNATDRQITYRNSGKETSLPASLPSPSKFGQKDDVTVPFIREFAQIDPENPELSLQYIEADRKNREAVAKGTNTKQTVISGKNTESLQAGLSYKVYAYPTLNGEYIDVPMYIENVGGDWAIGNATFGITYDPNGLKFVDLVKNQTVIFDTREDLGYFPLFTSPKPTAKDPVSNLRTIDVDYDIYSDNQKSGSLVPHSQTYLGTLKFKVISPKDAYSFKWHFSTVVYKTTGENVTGDGDFLPITPIFMNKAITVVFPNGGEQLTGGRPYDVKWTKPTNDVMGYVDFSTDNGSSWVRITSSPISLLSGTYNWNVPRVNSTECLIALVNSTTNTMIDKSDAPFTILAAPAAITRPASTDPTYRGGAADFIRWDMAQNAKVKFEFSENGIDNWKSVTPVVDSKKGETNWNLPAVNACGAVVRMINAETGDVLAMSSPFKILAGSLTLVNPVKGEKIKYGTKKQVRWTYDNVNNYNLELSVDGGKKWSVIAENVKASLKSYDWMIPNVNSNNVIIRATSPICEDLEYSRSQVFEIYGATDVETPIALGYEFNKATPNPFTQSTQMSFTIPNDEYVTITVYNTVGQEIITLASNEFFTAGTHSVVLNANNLTTGLYIVRFNAGTVNMTQEVVLVK